MSKENTLTTKNDLSHSVISTDIESLIHNIRGQQVILDFDLARLYEVETKYLKRAVRANATRFPDDFMFELSAKETNNLRCNFCTSSEKTECRGIYLHSQTFRKDKT